MTTAIQAVDPNEFGLEKTEATQIKQVFVPMLEEMETMEQDYNTIISQPITDELTKQARELRLKYVKVRSRTKEVHTKAKAYYLAGGKFVDALRNVQLFSASEKEENLEKIEKHFELIEQQKQQQIFVKRTELLSKYVDDVSMYNYKEMSDEVFEGLVKTVQTAWEATQQAIKKAEQDRLEAEKKEKEEQEKMRLENARLKAEAEEREKQLAEERAEAEIKLEEERKKSQVEADARAKAEAIIENQRQEELRIKKEAEEKAKADRLAELEAEKQAALAPDREKLIAYSVALASVTVPKLETQEAKEILKKSLDIINQAITLLKSN